MAEEKKNTIKEGYIATVGRRKESVARIRLYQEVKSNLEILGEKVKKGDFFVNNKRAFDYFKDKISKLQLEEPFRITNTLDKFALTAKVSGGGQKGQLEAIIHAVSRALAKLDQKNRQILKKKGFLTRDPRVRQRRNVGMGGKARRKKQSPKR
ncbi:MAG: 30S ribosomal protein S9 [Candidatus Levybacteria bacterium RBG_16_35_11]|nr:MAG: 30S ribosomal protein S9 [Candidatus Levybacteria bacterium RBG_16_35_11]